MGTMKVMLGWLYDPCVHLIGIGLVVGYLIMGTGSESETENLADSLTRCPNCAAMHFAGTACPMLAVQQDRLPASN
jgi:hypothetical protein